MIEIDGREYLRKLPKRLPESHKGDYGHLLVLGGSAGFGGAPALAALGALRAGAGLVSVALPASLVCGSVASLVPEAMAHPMVECAGKIVSTEFLNWLYARKPFDVVLAGPGLGQSDEIAEIVSAFLKIDERRLLLDADALNTVASCERGLEMVAAAPFGYRILTPHHGEAARLLNCEIAEVVADRFGAAMSLAKKANCIVVLKGHNTIVCANGRTPEVCMAGNPGMATGGSGDVLAGVIAALWGQGMEAFDAAALGVHLHAVAGDIAASKVGERSLIARDIADNLGAAFQSCV